MCIVFNKFYGNFFIIVIKLCIIVLLVYVLIGFGINMNMMNVLFF